MGLDPSSGRQDCCLWQHVSPTYSKEFPIQPMQLLLKYDSELALHRSCCRSSKQDGSVSSGTWHGWAICKTRPELRRFAGYPRTGGAAQDVHVAPGYGPWKQTSSRSITVWTQPGDSLRTEDDGSNSWKRLRSSQGHARDDDESDSDCDFTIMSLLS